MRIMLRIAVAIQILCSTLTVAASETKRVTIDGHEFAYVEQGQGDPVLLVHGGLQDYRYWQALQPELAHAYRVVAYSRRNRFPFPLRGEIRLPGSLVRIRVAPMHVGSINLPP